MFWMVDKVSFDVESAELGGKSAVSLLSPGNEKSMCAIKIDLRFDTSGDRLIGWIFASFS